MAIQPSARVTAGHLKTAATLHRKMAGIVLTEEQRLEWERQRTQVRMEARAAGERPA